MNFTRSVASRQRSVMSITLALRLGFALLMRMILATERVHHGPRDSAIDRPIHHHEAPLHTPATVLGRHRRWPGGPGPAPSAARGSLAALATATHLTSTAEPPHHPGMDRRRFLLTSLAGALAAPLGAEAQQAGKMYRIGFLQTVPDTPRTKLLEVFRQGLRDLGYVEGQNIVIEHRVSREPKDNPGLLADLIGRRIDLLVTWTTPALVAAKQATTTIPIVGISGDPVNVGLVGSLGRPGGNLTGLAILTGELELKSLHLLKEAAPGIYSNRDSLEPRQSGLDARVEAAPRGGSGAGCGASAARGARL
jgi:hypothetical protein